MYNHQPYYGNQAISQLPVRTDSLMWPMPEYAPNVMDGISDQNTFAIVSELNSALAGTIASIATGNPLRTFIYNILMANGGNNQEYRTVLGVAFDIYSLSTVQNPQQRISDAVNNALFVFMQQCIDTFGMSLVNQCGDYVQSKLAEIQREATKIDYMLTSAGMQSVMLPPHPSMVPQQQAPMHRQQGMYPQQGMYQQQMPTHQQQRMMHQQPMHRQQMQQHPAYGRPQTAHHHAGQPTMQQQSGFNIRQPQQQYQRPSGGPVASAVQAIQDIAPINGVSVNSSRQSTLNIKDNKDKDNNVNQLDREVAHQLRRQEIRERIASGELSVVSKHWVPVQTINTKLVVETDEDGKTQYMLGKPMNFADHEIDKSLIEADHRLTKGALLPHWSSISKPEPVKLREERTDGELITLENVGEPILIEDTVCFGTSIKEIGTVVYAELADTVHFEEGELEKTYVETSAKLLTKTNKLNEVTTVVIGRLADAAKVGDFDGMLAEMKGMADYPTLRALLDKRLTEVINRRIRAGLGSSTRIDSFSGDWVELIEWLNKYYAETTVARFIDSLSKLLAAALSVVESGEESFFSENVSASFLPHETANLGLVLTDSFSVLVPAVTVDNNLDNVYVAFNEIIKRHKDTASRFFVTTKSGTVLELHRADVGNDNIIVSIVEA